MREQRDVASGSPSDTPPAMWDRGRGQRRSADENDRNTITRHRTIVPLPCATSDMYSPKSRMNSWVPTVLKNNGGLSSSRVGAHRSSGRSPASSRVGRPAGGARSLLPAGSWHTESHSGAFLAADSSVKQGSWRQRHRCSSRVARSAAARRRGLPQSRTIRRVVSTWC